MFRRTLCFTTLMMLLVAGAPAVAQQFCPPGMMFKKTTKDPIGDCACPDGQTRNFALTKGISKMGSCLQPSAVVTFMPSAFPALSLWLDALDPAKNKGVLPAGGSTVSTWSNQVDGPNASAVNGVAAPSFSTSLLNSRPAVSFAQSILTTGTANTTYKDNTFSVLLALQTSNSGVSLCNGDPKTINGFCLGYDTSLKPLFRFASTADGSAAPGFTTNATAISANTPHIISFTKVGTSHRLFVNGMSAAYSKNATPVTLTSSSGWTLGGIGNTGYFTGAISEALIYNRAISFAERERLEQYLSQKWGISVPSSLNDTLRQGMLVWLDADDPLAKFTAPTATGQFLTWFDKTANKNNAAPGTSLSSALGTVLSDANVLNARATMKTAEFTLGAINGRPGITLGTGMQYTIPVATNLSSTNYTLFFVGKTVNTNASNLVCLGSSFNNTCLRQMVSNGAYTVGIANNNGVAAGTSITSGRPFLASLVYDGSSYRLYVDGGSTAYTGAPAGTKVTLPSSFTLGQADLTSSFSGSIGEVQLFNSALSDTDRQTVEGYLKAKWGIGE